VDFVAAFASQKVDEMKKANIKFEVNNVTLAEDGNSAVVEAVVLGKSVDKKEVYIKISKGTGANSPICVSFHLAERKIEHPFKNKK
jgi:hypothetical protein